MLSIVFLFHCCGIFFHSFMLCYSVMEIQSDDLAEFLEVPTVSIAELKEEGGHFIGNRCVFKNTQAVCQGVLCGAAVLHCMESCVELSLKTCSSCMPWSLVCSCRCTLYGVLCGAVVVHCMEFVWTSDVVCF